MDDQYTTNGYHHEEGSFASGFTTNSSQKSHSSVNSLERKLAQETEAYLREHRSTGNLKTLLHIATQNLLGERNRADEAVAQVHELTSKMKEINDAKRLAVREAERAVSLLQEYKTRYEEAQREIYIAQNVFNEVDERRRIAEQELADAKATIRRLNQQNRVWNAREEGRRVGLTEGWTRGWAHQGPDGEHQFLQQSSWDPPAGYPPTNRSTVYSETSEGVALSTRHSEGPNTSSTTRDTRRSQTSESPPQAVSSNGHRPSPPLQTQQRPTQPVPPPQPQPQPQRVIPIPQPTPIPASILAPVPVPPPVAQRQQRTTPPRDPDEYVPSADDIRPIIVQTIGSPSPRHPPINLPPDGFIPSLGPDQRLHIPPAHEFSAYPSPEQPPSPRLPTPAETTDTEPPLMIHPDPSPETRRRRSAEDARHSSADSFSTDFSQLSLIRHSKNEPIISPLSAIQEVRSGYTSPNPQSLSAVMDQQSYMSGHQTPRSVGSRQQTRQPSVRTSVSSSLGGDALNIDVQGPSPPASTRDRRKSRPISASLSGWGGVPPLDRADMPRREPSPAVARQPSPRLSQQQQQSQNQYQQQPSQRQYQQHTSAFPQASAPVYHMTTPATQGSVSGYSSSTRPTYHQPSSSSGGGGGGVGAGSFGAGNTHYRSSGPTVIPDPSLLRGGSTGSQLDGDDDDDDDDFGLDEDDDFESVASRSRSGRGGGGGGDEDDDRAVSSGMSDGSRHDSLMTPKEQRKRLSGEGSVSVGRSAAGGGGGGGYSGGSGPAYGYQASNRSTGTGNGSGSRRPTSRTTDRSGR
ncbi:hypothetical protein BDN72DRAFT_892917 [Pluteus cervinus]|uniref:Uncharacterized protein n=1 Tax=Pluteus cervinus TaxID=181527 RepID=A0ACD3B8T0_9AGAR|nr:hypothetical protein BDN72DRAFT_892917 [Pluteus cervinus]